MFAILEAGDSAVDDPNPVWRGEGTPPITQSEERDMKFFSNSLMVLASLALCTGCEADPQNTDSSTTAQNDGGSNDGGNTGSDISSAGFEDVKLAYGEWGSGYVSIQAKTPDGKPATFYVCRDNSSCYKDPVDGKIIKPEWTFKDTTNFELHTAANFKGDLFFIYAERENHLFVPLHFTAQGDKANPKKPVVYAHEWKDVGSWGLAPNGTYLDTLHSNNKPVVTSVKNGKVTLTYAKTDAIVTHDAFSPNDQDPDLKLSGQISDDLSKVQLKAEFPNLPNKNYETTLTIVK